MKWAAEKKKKKKKGIVVVVVVVVVIVVGLEIVFVGVEEGRVGCCLVWKSQLADLSWIAQMGCEWERPYRNHYCHHSEGMWRRIRWKNHN